MLNKKVHLVLGSGGARGIAHIAVIEELEKEGYEIVEVIGCSMGAVVGGIYAAGHLPEYKKWLTSLTRKEVFDLLDFTFTKQGFVKGEKLFANSNFGNKQAMAFRPCGRMDNRFNSELLQASEALAPTPIPAKAVLPSREDFTFLV